MVPSADGSLRRTEDWLPIRMKVARSPSFDSQKHKHTRTQSCWCSLLDHALCLTMKLAQLISVLPCLAIGTALCVCMCVHVWEEDSQRKERRKKIKKKTRKPKSVMVLQWSN